MQDKTWQNTPDAVDMTIPIYVTPHFEGMGSQSGNHPNQMELKMDEKWEERSIN